MARMSRKHILMNLPILIAENDWIVSGNMVDTLNPNLGLTKTVGKERYYFDYHPEHDVFVRLRKSSKMSKEILDQAFNMGITRKDYLANAENKRCTVDYLDDTIRTLRSEWLSCDKTKVEKEDAKAFPYNINVKKAFGIHKNDESWDCKGYRYGKKREWYMILPAISNALYVRQGYKDISVLSDSAMADLLYVKMRYLITGSIPQLSGVIGRYMKSRGIEQPIEVYTKELLDWIDDDLVTLWRLARIDDKAHGYDKLMEIFDGDRVAIKEYLKTIKCPQHIL